MVSSNNKKVIQEENVKRDLESPKVRPAAGKFLRIIILFDLLSNIIISDTQKIRIFFFCV